VSLVKGDVVIYRHKKHGEPLFDGSLGIVREIRNDGDSANVHWFLPKFDSHNREIPYLWNLEKIGHIDADKI
jgi:hypothetical protein